jgi:ribonucleoside-diphosphate reductase alpha chain
MNAMTDLSAATAINLPPQVVSTDVFLEKYAKDDETTHNDVFVRVAKGLAAVEKTPELRTKWEALFLKNMENGALGAGRIMSAAGTGIAATLANCFVQPVGDCIQGFDDNGYPGIYDALRMAAETMRRGGGVGYDFSRIRPLNAFVKGTNSYASGPCSYMDVFDASCKTVESAGSRRGAQMGILRIDHPDVLDFITAKRTQGRWNNFNVSVGIVDGFMDALDAKGEWQLVHAAKPSQKLLDTGSFQREDGMWVYRVVNAQEIWDTIMGSTYDFAEPGIVFLENMNKDNNLRYCELIEATNPCGEQPLPAYGCCDLGPINLTRFVRSPFGFNNTPASFDFDAFAAVIGIQTRMLDNVLDATMWPLPEQQKESQNKRRIGVGFTGLGDTLVMMGVRYDSEEGRALAKAISECLRDSAYMASVELAKERGAFPLFDADKYLEEGTFASRLPKKIKAAIRKYGIRNSHLVSIAPVGTISLAFGDNASNGIEPAFSWSYNRVKREADGSKSTYAVEDHAFRMFLEMSSLFDPLFPAQMIRDALANGASSIKIDSENETPISQLLPASFVTALEMSATDHLKIMEVVQPFIDSAISKTVNVPADYSFEDFKDLYLQAYKAGLKGIATYRPNTTLGSVLSVPVAAPAPAEQAAPAPAPVQADIDPLKVVVQSRPAGTLPGVTDKITYMTQEGKKSLYAIVSFMPVDGIIGGKKVTVERPIEIFIPAGQEGESQQWITVAMRSLSLNARAGFIAKALKDMRKVTWDRGPVRCGFKTKLDGTVTPMYHDSEAAAIGYALQQILIAKGFLDMDGNQIPASVLVAKHAQLDAETVDDILAEANADAKNVHELTDSVEETLSTSAMPQQLGKKCYECGAHAVVKRDGCETCTACGALGSCG